MTAILDPGPAADTTADPAWTPIRVTAHLTNPVARLDTNPLHLDGPLAWSASRDWIGAHGHHALPPMATTPVDFALPLATWTAAGTWGWACSAAWAPTRHPVLLNVRRKPHAAAMARYGRTAKHHLAQGPLKAWDVPVPAVLAPEVMWWVLGDPERVGRLLAGVTHLGAKTAAGNGRIRSWDITVDEAARERWRWRHWPHPDGHPTPVRAPYHHPARLVPCAPLGEPPWA